MEHVRWHREPEVHTPTIVAAFTGWNDAADAASNAVRALIGAWDGQLVASVDPEEFTDFATTRPHVRLRDDNRRELLWPQVSVWSASTPGGDVLLILGPEPSLRWRTFAEQIGAIAEKCEATLLVTLGALLADVPHTRPVQLIGTGSDDDVIDRFDLQRSTYEGPTGIVGVLQDVLGGNGLPSASLWAATPTYAAQVPSPRAALALLRRVTEMIGAPTPITDLLGEIAEYDERVGALVEGDDDLPDYIRRLEASVGSDEDDEPIDTGEAGESLIEELEQFLRDQDG